MDVLEEIEGKAIIWANYQKDITNIIESIVKKYGPGSVVDYYGLTPQDERQGNIKKFQDDPECRFLIGTPQTGGYGITCLLYTSPSPRDGLLSRMPSSA